MAAWSRGGGALAGSALARGPCQLPLAATLCTRSAHLSPVTSLSRHVSPVGTHPLHTDPSVDLRKPLSPHSLARVRTTPGRAKVGRVPCHDHGFVASRAMWLLPHEAGPGCGCCYTRCRVQVLSLGDARSYYLSTAKNELGVVYAKSAAAGACVLRGGAGSWDSA